MGVRGRLLGIALGLVAVWLAGSAASAATPVKVLFDTDMMTDCDDAGAMAVLHALADRGECQILATVVSSTDRWSVATVDAINTYYGRPNLPIGIVQGKGVLEHSKFIRRIGEDFPNDFRRGEGIPDATIVYRDTLEAEPDESVVVVTVGYLTNLKNLMQMPASDGHLSGLDLIKRKVKTWVCMGGNFVGDPPRDDLKLGNVNFQRDAESALAVIRYWPKPVVFVGREIGSVPSGLTVGESLARTPLDNPVRMAYFHYFGAQKSRHVADLTTVLYAVRGLRDYWGIQTKGRMELHSDMTFEWQQGEESGQAYLLKRQIDGKPNDRAIEGILDELLTASPKLKDVPLVSSDARYQLQLDRIHRGFDGQTCWVHPRAGVIPGATPTVVLTMQKLLLTGSDIFFALNEMQTSDLGKTWSGPVEQTTTLGRREEPGGVVVATCDFTPKWHAKSGKLLGIGHTVHYLNDKQVKDSDRATSYAVYDPQSREWVPWRTLNMPDTVKFQSAGAGCVQRVDLPDGDILLPIYFKSKEQKQYSSTVLRCGFDGTTLTFKEQGNELSVPIERGLCEPSLTRFRDRYFLTLRNDRAGYVSTSADGLHFDAPRIWCWDDGSELGNYNTQQHWVTHADALYLVYTRTGANNDHVFRHRAPLFIAEVNPETLRVIRASEQVLIPERGARYGNFGVTEVNENETWVTESEWMQTWPPNYIMRTNNPYGADNSVYAARIHWTTPNRGWNER